MKTALGAHGSMALLWSDGGPRRAADRHGGPSPAIDSPGATPLPAGWPGRGLSGEWGFLGVSLQAALGSLTALPCLPRVTEHPAGLCQPLFTLAPFLPALAAASLHLSHPLLPILPMLGTANITSREPPDTRGDLTGRVSSRTVGLKVSGDPGSTLLPPAKH